MIFKPHTEKQQRAIYSPKKIVCVGTGIQWGKTVCGAIKLKLAYHKNTSPDDNFIVMAPTYKIMQQSTLPEFKKWCRLDGRYNKVDQVFNIHGGGTIYFRTATDPDSIVGMTRVKFMWLDEAGKYSLYAWENAQGRSAFCNCPIVLTTSPYTLNWVYKEIIRPLQKNRDSKPNIELIQARSDENPYFPKEVYDEKKKTMEPRRFRMMFGGEWEKMEGLVYDVFDEEMMTVEPVVFPAGTKFYCGIDWGYTNPFALVLRAITPEGLHYQISEIYKPGLTITDIGRMISKLKVHWPITMCYCDPSNPQNIEELNRLGIPAVGANNDIRYGLDCHYELMKTGKYKLFKKFNKFTIDEYETYHYPEDSDEETDKDIKEHLPVKQSDHAMDANRYVTVETYRLGEIKPDIIKISLDKKELPHKTKNNRTLHFNKNITETWE